jgi:STE24 endopeptidase
VTVILENLLIIFLVLRFLQHLFEQLLGFLNRKYYRNPQNQKEALDTLKITSEDLQKTLAYSQDKFRFGVFSEWFDVLLAIAFIGLGGLGWVEGLAQSLASPLPLKPMMTGLVFFASLGLLASLLGLPFSLYHTFVIEEKHGFNKQTIKGFFVDRFKGMVLACIMGAIFLGVLLWVMENMGKNWWLYAWAAASFFSILTAWIFPTLLAPLFNKFTPLPEGELKEKILNLSEKIGFKTSGLFVMDASKRSAHGNAYFTGLFGEKRIVLFDTLVEMLNNKQIVAVLAHELGHFKLHHVRWGIVRGIAMTGLFFYILHLCLPLEVFYQSFFLQGVSSYGALIVFGLWFGPIGFLFSPLSSHLSRKNEFAADRFAKKQLGTGEDLSQALLTLREKSHSMPLTHPIFSLFYHSHPPIIERIRAL